MVISGLVQLIVVMVVLGLVWWLVTTYIPMKPPIPVIVNVLFALILIVVLLQAFGIVNLGDAVRVRPIVAK